MKKENIKIVAADIDGTLMGKGQLTPSEATLNCIRDLRSHGILFGLASGRPYADIKKMYQHWHMEEQFDFLIGWNGCELWDSHTDIAYQFNYLSKAAIKEIIDFMRPSNSVVNMYMPEKFYSNQVTERALLSSCKTGREFILIDDETKYYEQDNGGIMFRSDEPTVKEYEEKLIEYSKDKEFAGFKTQPNLLEFSHKDSNKGYALKKYAELYNVSLDDVFAFGDTTNDNKMLECCHGVCLLNGSDDTKGFAEYITDKEILDDGFSDFVYKHIL